MDAMLLLKASLLLSLTLLAARLLRTEPAVTRHRLWTFAFAALLALPLLASALPVLRVPVPTDWAAPVSLPGPAAKSGDAAASRDSVAAVGDSEGASFTRGMARILVAGNTPPESRRGGLAAALAAAWSPGRTLLAIWLLGTIAAAMALMLSLLRTRQLARTAEEVADPAWCHAADALGARLGLRHPARLVVSPRVGTPMAGGVWHPVIFLPVSARAWRAEQRDVVLAHELAHLARRDPLRHVVARLAVAFYWFHPLAWMAARHATVAREQACDETVLALGTRPSAYARVLLDLAESLHRSAPALGALPMVERSLLETRLMAILNDDPRPAKTRRVLIPAIGVIVLTLSVAAAQPFAPATTPGGVPALGAMAGPAPVPETSIGAATSTANVATRAVPGAVAQPDVPRDSACWWDGRDGRTFSGSMSSRNADGRTVIYEQIGWRGDDRVIQKSFGDLRLCMLAEGVGDHRDPAARPSHWIANAEAARRVVLEARRGSVVQQLEIERVADARQRTVWRVGSAERAVDAGVRQWRDRMLAVLDTTWELSILRGEVSSLRGEISSIRGHQSSQRGEISSLRGHVSSLRGQASSIRGNESSLRGQISSIRGHLSSLRGAISSERGAISSVNATRYQATDAERASIDKRIAQHEAEIERIERDIRDFDADAKVAAVEREIAAFSAEQRVAKVEAEIRAFDLDGKVAAIERRIAGLDVEGKVRAIERQIEALDADRRGRQLEDRRDSELKQLEAAIAAIR